MKTIQTYDSKRVYRLLKGGYKIINAYHTFSGKQWKYIYILTNKKQIA